MEVAYVHIESPVPAHGSRRARALRKVPGLNPHLLEGRGSYQCAGLWNLLYPAHFPTDACCRLLETEIKEAGLSACFLDRIETWLDKDTGTTVLVSHTHCRHSEQGGCQEAHETEQMFLSRRGLWYSVSSGSWHPGDLRLLVIARMDVLDRTRLPYDQDYPAPPDLIVNGKSLNCLIRKQWKRLHQETRALDGMALGSLTRDATRAGQSGDYDEAIELYLNAAKGLRVAGQHAGAQALLNHVNNIISGHGITACRDWDRRYFDNDDDRTYIVRQRQTYPTSSTGYLYRHAGAAA